jgi:DnaD/phage-associated family protein
MANPQPDDSHLRISHSIEEQIMMSMFSERPLRVLLFILRLSWGCGKHSAYIPRQKDFELCGVREFHIKQVLDWLINADVIIRDGDYYQFNKDFDHWHVSRAFNYNPQKLTELVSLNIQEPDQELRKLTELVSSKDEKLTNSVSSNTPELTNSVSSDLPKRQETTYQKGKFVEPGEKPLSPHTPYTPVIKTLIENISTTAAAAPENILGDIFKSYESNIGQLTPAISERIKVLITEFPTAWLTEATEKAARANKRSLSYIEGILKGWQRDGKNNEQSTGKSGPTEENRSRKTNSGKSRDEWRLTGFTDDDYRASLKG